ncbi:hypothetical protein, partial [Halomonas sp. BC04]|uniref:hypothetical protein n=1 Tax=Halomonas sp. BC04 TaxID=1403540 RepID=UPI0018CBF341
MAVTISDPIRYAPVTRSYRRWLALSAALLLHLALIGVVASFRFAPAPPERSSLDVVLVTQPAEVPVEADAWPRPTSRPPGSLSKRPPPSPGRRPWRRYP